MTAQMISRNGASNGAVTAFWLQTSVQQFFGGFNWEDLPPDVQQVKSDASQPPNLSLSVSQFFASFNWDGAEIAAASPVQAAPTAAIDVTIDDFFSQF